MLWSVLGKLLCITDVDVYFLYLEYNITYIYKIQLIYDKV